MPQYSRYLLPLNKDPFEQEGVNDKYQNSLTVFDEVCRKAKLKGINIILVDDVPQMKLPIRVASCILQSQLGLPNSCDVDRVKSLHARKPMTKLFKSLEAYDHVYYWDPHNLICDSEKCTFQNESFVKSQDFNHITKAQAEALAPNFNDFLVKNNLLK